MFPSLLTFKENALIIYFPLVFSASEAIYFVKYVFVCITMGWTIINNAAHGLNYRQHLHGGGVGVVL